MISNTIPTALLTALATTCPVQQPQPTMHALTAPSRQEQPEQERPERTEPPHGEGSGESPMFGGMGVYGNLINVSNTASGTVHFSAASGNEPYASVAWLPNHLPLITSIEDFEIEPLMPSRAQVTIRIRPDTTKHLSNPSMIQVQRAVTRRR